MRRSISMGVAIALGATGLGTGPVEARPASGQAATETCRPNEDRQRRNQSLGNALGALGGALLGDRLGLGGSQGRNLGAQLGGSFAGFLDSCDRQQADGATQEALNGTGGRPVEWTSRNNQGVGGTAVVTRQRQTPDGETCRTVTEIAYRAGEEVEESVEYCRDGTGRWDRRA